MLLTLLGCAVEPPADKGELQWELRGMMEDQTIFRTELNEFGELQACVHGVPVFDADYGPATMELSIGAQRFSLSPGDELHVCWQADSLQPVTIEYVVAGDVLDAHDSMVEIASPDVADCYEAMDLYNISYTKGPSKQGVTDPVTVTMPINGVSLRAYGADEVRKQTFMDCRLAVALARAASPLRRRDIYEIEDIGIYNYRCIGGGDPPCKLSQHAYARGIDIAGVKGADGTYYSVLDDWVIDQTGGTCDGAERDAKDALLHELICDMSVAGIWHVALTPNYNAAHRNHFHVDLTEGSDFIRNHSTSLDTGPHAH